MSELKLSLRLSEVQKNIEGKSFADIGCDHGKLPVSSIVLGKADFAIAADISEKSLFKAKELSKKYGVTNKMSFRVGDGLRIVHSGEVNSIVIAGLGGDEISDILKQSYQDKKKFDCFVLSPNTHPEKVRETAIDCKLKFLSDYLVFEKRHFYPIIKLSSLSGRNELDENEVLFGFEFYRDANFFVWAKKEMEKCQSILRKAENLTLKDRYEKIREAYEKYNGGRH